MMKPRKFKTEGLLWYDAKNRPVAARVRDALDYARSRCPGRRVAEVRVSFHDIPDGDTEVDGAPVTGSPLRQRGQFYVVWQDDEQPVLFSQPETGQPRLL